MTMAVRIETIEGERRHPRGCADWRMSHGSGHDGESGWTCAVRHLSESGLLIETRARLQLGNQIFIGPGASPAALARVCWSSGFFHGCDLVELACPLADIASLLKHGCCGDPYGQRLLAHRCRRKAFGDTSP